MGFQHFRPMRAWGQLPSKRLRLYGPSHAGMGATFYLRELIEAGLDDLEDAYLGAAALEAHRRSGEATIPLDQVMRNLGLEG